MSDEAIDFVFLDDANTPFRIRTWGGALWIFYWHLSLSWVSLRPAKPEDVLRFGMRKMPDEQAALYHEISDRHTLPLETKG